MALLEPGGEGEAGPLGQAAPTGPVAFCEMWAP